MLIATTTRSFNMSLGRQLQIRKVSNLNLECKMQAFLNSAVGATAAKTQKASSGPSDSLLYPFT